MKAWILSSNVSRRCKIIGALLALACAGSAATHAQSQAIIAKPAAASAVQATVAKPATKPAPVIAKNTAKPYWNDLTPAQHEALAPLATEWDKLKKNGLSCPKNFRLCRRRNKHACMNACATGSN
jgi:hypothetical protein